jgi:hypothetical protein
MRNKVLFYGIIDQKIKEKNRLGNAGVTKKGFVSERARKE